MPLGPTKRPSGVGPIAVVEEVGDQIEAAHAHAALLGDVQVAPLRGERETRRYVDLGQDCQSPVAAEPAFTGAHHGRDDLRRCIDAAHAAVPLVGDVQVARRVGHDVRRSAQLRRRRGLGVAVVARGSRPGHHVQVRAVGVDLVDLVAALVGDQQRAVRSQVQTLGKLQSAGHGGDDLVGGRDAPHAAVERVGVVDRAAGVGRDVARRVHARRRGDAAVGGEAGDAGAGDGGDDVGICVDAPNAIAVGVGDQQRAVGLPRHPERTHRGDVRRIPVAVGPTHVRIQRTNRACFTGGDAGDDQLTNDQQNQEHSSRVRSCE